VTASALAANSLELASGFNLKHEIRTLLEEAHITLNIAASELLPKDPDLRPLADTLSEFIRFSRDYVQFFANRPNSLNEQHAVVEKIQREWLTLKPLVEQRRLGHLAGWLKMADTIATDCIRTGVLHTRDCQDCLTLFDRTYHMARFAYSRVPGLGIPLANQKAPWQWLGIGHEIGHYHFRNHPKALADRVQSAVLKSLSRQLFDRQSQDHLNSIANIHHLSLWGEWMEEVFADVYGALVLGPACVRSLMIWLRPRHTAETLLDNDHDHALPLLRPLIQIQALKELQKLISGSDQQEIDTFGTARLQLQWEDACAALAPGNQGMAYWLDQPVDGITVGELANTIPTVVGAIVKVIIIAHGEEALRACYTQDIHQQVLAAAAALADGQLAAEGSAIRPAWALPIVWYAWEYTLANDELTEDAREARLEHITELAKQLVGSYAAAASAEAGMLPLSDTKPDGPSAQPAASFARLLIHLKKSGSADSDAIARRLLEDEFSTEEEQIGNFSQHTHSSLFSHTHYHPA